MSFEAIQAEVSTWPDDQVSRLQGYLVMLSHRRSGRLEELSAKLDDPDPKRWRTLDDVAQELGLDKEP